MPTTNTGSPTEHLVRTISEASEYGAEYDCSVQHEPDGDGYLVNTMNEEEDEPGPLYQLSYFGQLGGRILLRLISLDDQKALVVNSGDNGEPGLGVANLGKSDILVEAKGRALFALLYA
jgi:hypothetical protein